MVSVKFNKLLFKLYMQYFELLHVKDKSGFVDVLKLSDSNGMHVK